VELVGDENKSEVAQLLFNCEAVSPHPIQQGGNLK